ncbi:IclR family transcriptional regulator [Xanthobacteraceae bacterium Astr-EGSB]|uniref:IclR family transcriptional regulator n=1 Tax=Astrobacterium formosum TaxID=3069710 RepID=UPI0027B4789A|nr:IclR family transcriptional regulator [Xanthobacteraceae bacterium Astr-EGSB]
MTTETAKKSPTTSRPQEDNLKSLSKVVAILNCFSTDRRSLSLAEICAMLDYPRSTTHRFLASMREVGLLDQDKQRGNYRLGIRLFEYGNTVLANLDLHREAAPFVEALQRLTNLTVHLAVFDGLRAVVVRCMESSNGVARPSTLIENAPSYCTSLGKAILAFQPKDVVKHVIERGLEPFTERTITTGPALLAELKRTRERGYALDEGEHQPGLLCIGAPIRDENGRVFASISVNGPAWKIPIEKADELSKIVIHNANQISRRLGAS